MAIVRRAAGKIKGLLLLALFVFLWPLASCRQEIVPPGPPDTEEFDSELRASAFSFIVAADMRSYTGSLPQYFRGACEAMARTGPDAFVVSPGDVDPPAGVLWTLQAYVDPDIPWYPVVGNHEVETPQDMAWLRAFNAGGKRLPHIVRSGPAGAVETCFSFEYQNAHFTVINEYFRHGNDAYTKDGDVPDGLWNWLDEDLDQNTKPVVFVLGHEPAFPQPDAESGRRRHIGDSLDEHPGNRDRFWRTLADHGVKAYLCGHTHNFSLWQKDGVWQLDCAHARGMQDKGARSTFVRVTVNHENNVGFAVYRLSFATRIYELTQSGIW